LPSRVIARTEEEVGVSVRIVACRCNRIVNLLRTGLVNGRDTSSRSAEKGSRGKWPLWLLIYAFPRPVLSPEDERNIKLGKVITKFHFTPFLMIEF